MTKLTKHINWNISLERNNTIINLVYKNKSVYLSKKDIWELFNTKKSIIKDIIEDLQIENSEVIFNKSKNKNSKLYNLESVLLIGYKLKKFNDTKLLIKTNRIIKNSYLDWATILEIVKNKYREIKTKFSLLEI